MKNFGPMQNKKGTLIVIGILTAIVFLGGIGLNYHFFQSKFSSSTTPEIQSAVTPLESQNAGSDHSQVTRAENTAVATTAPSATTPTEESPKTLPVGTTEKVAGCHTIKFKHKQMTSHADGELCTQHDNILKLPRKDYDLASLCVRVNGTPVAHKVVKDRHDEIFIGSVAGPNSEVSIRFCSKNAPCKEDCKIPKDEFLSAIGGSADDSDELNAKTPTVYWDSQSAPSKEEQAVDGEMAEMKDAMQTVGSAKGGIFKDWINTQQTDACPMQQAQIMDSQPIGRNVASRH